MAGEMSVISPRRGLKDQYYKCPALSLKELTIVILLVESGSIREQRLVDILYTIGDQILVSFFCNGFLVNLDSRDLYIG